MNLAQRLRNIRHEFETGDTPREIIDTLNAHVDELLSGNLAERSLAVGEKALLDLIVGDDDQRQTLRSLMGDRFLVLTWFRGNW